MQKLPVAIFFFSFILTLSGVIYLMTKNNPAPDSVETPPVAESETAPQTTVTPPPPAAEPARYWSELTAELLKVETTQAQMLAVLLEKYAPPAEKLPKLLQIPTSTPIEVQQLVDEFSVVSTSWINVGQQIVELEQQRQKLIDVLTEKSRSQKDFSEVK